MSNLNSVSAVLNVIEGAKRITEAKTLDQFVAERDALRASLKVLEGPIGAAAAPTKTTRKVSAATRRKMSAAQKARHAAKLATATAAADGTETQLAAKAPVKKRAYKKRANKSAAAKK